MAAEWGVPGEFAVAASSDAVIRINLDSVSGVDRGPPDAIEILGGGLVYVVCQGDETAGPEGGAIVRTLGSVVPLANGEVLNGLSVVWIQKAGSTITGVRVRWQGGPP